MGIFQYFQHNWLAKKMTERLTDDENNSLLSPLNAVNKKHLRSSKLKEQKCKDSVF